MSIYVEKMQLVAPGELLAEGTYYAGESTYKEDTKIFASRIGLVDISDNRLNIVPLKGCYIPQVDDTVIGRIVDVGMSGWFVNIGAPYPALLPASEALQRGRSFPQVDLTRIFDVTDLVVAKVIAFDRTRDPLLSVKGMGLGKVNSGRVVELSPPKIPRLIGRKGSMIGMIAKETGCRITVGQNGVILISGRSALNERVAMAAIYMIEREAHTRGLTDRIREMLMEEIGGKETGKSSGKAA